MQKFFCCLQVLLLFISSCSGQKASTPTNNKNINIAIGDTVKELGNNLMHIMQDRNNNYWFGSRGEGVYRYDGMSIIHFTLNDGLCNNNIEGIQEDRSGNIYFNTQGGISKFDGKTFTTLKIMESNLPGVGWKLTPDDLWFKGAQDSGVVYRYDGKILHRLKFPENKTGEEFFVKYPRAQYPAMAFNPYDVYTIYKDSKGNVWFGTGMLGVCRYDGKSFMWITEDELGFSGHAYGVRSVIEDRTGTFWFTNTMYHYTIYSNDSLNIQYKKERGPGKIKVYNDTDPDYFNDYTYFMSAIEDKNGELWLVTYNAGVWRYNVTDDEPGNIITHYPVRDGDKKITLFSIYKDRQGSLWLGTHENGVYKFNGKTFERFRPLG